ncbi:winged helix-turn-helix domain-containing protein [Arthrobacter oryzae]|uniref:winged helix-turn-helix domain-containing protein n=1 Tax=Arthrobacter oryzae TaxID=409290 RepID=UPI0035933E34
MANILMNRTRSRLVRFLITCGPASCSEAAVALGLARSTVRRHAALLSEAGIITGTATLGAEPDQVKRQLADLEAAFQTAEIDFKNRVTDASHSSVAPFHSRE